MTAKPVQRIRSVRAYRRILDELLQQARRGEIPWREVNQAAAALKVASEAMMAENLLANAGVKDNEVGTHELGDDGGLEDYAPHKKAKRAKRHRSTRKAGTTAKGVPIDETTNMVEN